MVLTQPQLQFICVALISGFQEYDRWGLSMARSIITYHSDMGRHLEPSSSSDVVGRHQLEYYIAAFTSMFYTMSHVRI
jgi:hypothetical protein